MPFANHDGDRIHYQTYGAGPPLVIQHGLFSSAADLAYPQFVEAVSDVFEMIFIDSLGHGRSDKPDDASHYTREHRAGDIIAVLDDLGIEKAHYFGYSMGGWIGCAVARHAPERLKSLCIAGWPVERDEQLREAFENVTFDDMKRLLYFDNPKDFGRITAETEPALRHCWRAASETDGAKDDIKNLNVPVLMLCGEEDPMFKNASHVAREIDVPFMAVPGNHGEAINQYLGHYFPDVAEFFLKAEVA